MHKSSKGRAIQTMRGWMENGRLRVGDVMPCECGLAEEFGLSRGTVRAALAELERAGLLSRRKHCRPIVAGAAPGHAVMVDTVVVLSILAHKHHPVFSGYIKAIDAGAMQTIQSKGFHSLTIHPGKLAGEGLLKLVRARPRGILIPDPLAVREDGQDFARHFKQMGLPVIINADGGGLAENDRVISDHEAGTRRIMAWLLERGCRRILRVWANADERWYWLAGRDAGYEAATSEAGVPCLPPVRVLCRPAGERERFDTNVRIYAGHLVEHFRGNIRPDALMLTCDVEVPEVAAACRLFGLEPNRDIVIAGYDNMWRDWPGRKFEPTPPAVTVDKLNAQIGAAMVELLLDRLAGQLPPEAQRRVVESKLVFPAEEETAVTRRLFRPCGSVSG